MILEIKIPSPGESISEVEIGRWLAEDGAVVTKGDEIAEVESDKATLTLTAEASGKLSIQVQEGESVAVGAVAGTIDTSVPLPEEGDHPAAVFPGKEAAATGEGQGLRSADSLPGDSESIPESSGVKKPHQDVSLPSGKSPQEETASLKITAVAREVMKEHGLSVNELLSGLKRIGRREVEEVIKFVRESDQVKPAERSREVTRERMTPLRRRLSERLVAVKNETAMLTTFNEIDMSAVMRIREMYQHSFTEKHGVKLGFMAFFTRAAALALRDHPSVNSRIEGEELVIPEYADIGMAVQTPKGLMVPVIRNAEGKSLAQLEQEIKELAEKARNRKITVDELSGGTFTITNGGVFGSLLSTPIINPPQSAILGLHKITERPVAVNGKVRIRPMMYVALSYDHRVIDGKDSVGFLVRIKELIENPALLASGGRNPDMVLLDL